MRIVHPTQKRAAVEQKAAIAKGGNTLGSLRYGGTGRQGLKKLQAPAVIPSDLDDCHTYGQALRPSTPIKSVVGNFYGEIQGFAHSIKAQELRHTDEAFRKSMLNPPKAHTRASAMASSFVNDGTMKKMAEDRDNAKDIFKMKKFGS